ncbi:DNA-directed RNA polymerase I subunit rpa49 [Thoreauomyces humboldtii]|nr:DNA-directed RNA polymerase I subunit rpa49 [Thoreauomyces humboldtii]
MSQTASAKKRKSASAFPAEPAVIDKSGDAPVFVSFPDFPSKPELIKWETYAPTTDAGAGAKKRRIVVGETAKLEYTGNNTATKNHCRYVVGVFDRTTKQLTLRETELVHLTTTVKSMKHHEAKHIGEKNMLARNALGEAFGTKKRRQAIRAYEKNQVDVGGLTEVADVIKGAIDVKAALLPTRQEILDDAKADRGIPPYNLNAQTPAEVYDPSTIFSDAELNSILYKKIWKARSSDEVKDLLAPIDLTSWVWERVHKVMQSKDDPIAFKRLLFIGYMMKLYRLNDRGLNSDNFTDKLGGAPKIIADSLVERFTEYQVEDDGNIKYRMSAKLKDTLLAYILTACLIVNDFKLDITHVSGDLKMSAVKTSKVARELGCRPDSNKKDGDGRTTKKVALVVPLTFPTRTR